MEATQREGKDVFLKTKTTIIKNQTRGMKKTYFKIKKTRNNKNFSAIQAIQYYILLFIIIIITYLVY